ncbi:MAG: hypothetical protein IPJ30_14320 [Acidobacteria bacterium]|nr:hypothetical protein [Acidobacteriota bacterium]
MTLRRGSLIKTERFFGQRILRSLCAFRSKKYLPNIYAQVDLVGASTALNDGKGEIDEKLAKRPAFASGQINLQISTESRKLNVSAEPESATIEPGGETKFNVAVTDFRSEPVANSEVAVVVVDESVLALSGYSIADPLGAFYGQRGSRRHRLSFAQGHFAPEIRSTSESRTRRFRQRWPPSRFKHRNHGAQERYERCEEVGVGTFGGPLRGDGRRQNGRRARRRGEPDTDQSADEF